MSSRRVTWPPAAMLAALMAAMSCSPAGETSSSSSLGGEQYNACSLPDTTIAVFGPEEFHRGRGKPVTETRIFQVPADGELCVVVVNGLHEPPQGHRVSSAWLSIDGTMVIGPGDFSQAAGRIQRPFPIASGQHELSIRLASKPGSFLSLELRLLAYDEEPPVISIEPANSSTVETDMPAIRVGFDDAGVGVNSGSLRVFLNGLDVTERFTIGGRAAVWQVGIDSYLEEGENSISVSVADRAGNTGSADSAFFVHTPTAVLTADLDHPESAFRRRSAYKLLCRLDEIELDTRRRCLLQLNRTPEPKAVDLLLEILQPETSDIESRVLAAGAVGEAAGVDPATSTRPELIISLGYHLLDDRSYLVKSVTARALGLTRNEQVLQYLEQFVCTGPNYPPQPWEEEDAFLIAVVGFQAMKAIVRIAGQSHPVCNPGDLMAIWRRTIDELTDYLFDRSGDGGAP